MLVYARQGYGSMRVVKDLFKIRNVSTSALLHPFGSSFLPPQKQNAIFRDNILPYLRSKQDFAVDDIIRSISRNSYCLLIAARLRAAIQRYSNSNQSTTSVSKDSDMNVIDKLDTSLKFFLLGYCPPSSLVLKKITTFSTCSHAQDIIMKEETNLSYSTKIPDLKLRLNKARRCYALFHRDDVDCMQPLSFVHVALTTHLISHLEDIENLDNRPHRYTHAMFYSINSCFDAGLRRVGISNHLITMTKERLFDENRFLRVASTLSPIPGFNKWLSSVSLTEKLSSSHQQMVAEAIEGIDGEATLDSTSKLADILHKDPAKLLLDDTRATKLKEPLMYLCARYLSHVRQSPGVPLDRVARFHLGNGAELGRINWLGDVRSKALLNGCGMMVNYIYNDGFMDKNRTQLIRKNEVEIGNPVRAILGIEQRAPQQSIKGKAKSVSSS